MGSNPFLDPKREIVQGKSEDDILAAHERRLAEAVEDAAVRRPEGMQGTGVRPKDSAQKGMRTPEGYADYVRWRTFNDRKSASSPPKGIEEAEEDPKYYRSSYGPF